MTPSYASDADVDRSASLLLNHKIFMSSGHDEYWSPAERANVTAARDAGVNLTFFSGNEIFWKTRWAASTTDPSTPYRTLITYKETHFNAVTDPQDPPTWTGTWEDPRFSPPADGGNPPNSLSGQMFLVNSGTTDIQVPADYSKLRLWRNTAAAKLTSGQTLTLGSGTGTLGYEWDEDADNGFRPAGVFDLSCTTAAPRSSPITGALPRTGTATHHLTLYRAPQRSARVRSRNRAVGMGPRQHQRRGESTTDPSGNPPDPNMEQATVNLFADMGVQPTTLTSDLVAASASPPTPRPPPPSITSPAPERTSPTAPRSRSPAPRLTPAAASSPASRSRPTAGPPGTRLRSRRLRRPTQLVLWLDRSREPVDKHLTRAVDDSGNMETPSDPSSSMWPVRARSGDPHTPTTRRTRGTATRSRLA